MPVMDSDIYSAQSYLLGATGNCYEPGADVDSDREFIHQIFRQEGIETDLSPVWDYPMSEIEHVVENNLYVVLVDCMEYDEEEHEYRHEKRWFEVPDGFSFP